LTAPLASVRSRETQETASAPPVTIAPTPPITVAHDVSDNNPPSSATALPKSVNHAKTKTAHQVEENPPISPEPNTPVSATPHDERKPQPTSVESVSRAPFECHVTPSVHETRATMMKQPLGDGPWFINEDKTIWTADQPYVAGREVNTVWMKPANTDLVIQGRRLDADAPPLLTKPGATFNAPYLAIGMTFPQPGCWEITGAAGDSKLTFITTVRE